MTENELKLVDAVRLCVAVSVGKGETDEQIRTETMASITTSFGRAYSHPAVAHLLPGYLDLARETLDRTIAGWRAERN